MATGKVPVSLERLDAIQQRLFAIALGIRSLRASEADATVAQELERLETEVDGLIREVRSRAWAPRSGTGFLRAWSARSGRTRGMTWPARSS